MRALGRPGRWILTATVVVLAGVGFWYVQPRSTRADKGAERVHSTSARARAIAQRYAEAVQTGNCEEVVALTAWMRERLLNAQNDPARTETPEAVRNDLCSTLQDRPVEGNRLRPEGVEDRYVFAPGASFEIVEVDGGRDNLSQPVESRVWFRVTYPARDRALGDESGRAIRSLKVGLNLSPDGYVVKAGVIGNLDVAPESITRAWGVDQGE